MYSGGGLLVNTIAIFASISSDVVAKEGLHKFRNPLNQIYWDRYCSYREFCIQCGIYVNLNKDNVWILEPKYKNSRTKVIGKAIADCVTGENVFAGRNAGDIITFKDTNPETYKQKHWNAVILYNYIHEAINGEGLPEKKDEYQARVENVGDFLQNKLSALKVQYKDLYHKYIDDAVKVIQEYVKTLRLDEELYEFRQSKQEYDKSLKDKGPNIAYILPHVDMNNTNSNKLCFDKFFHKLDENSYYKRWRYIPLFRYAGDKLYISGAYIQEESYDANYDDNDNWRIVKYEYIAIDDIEGVKELDGKLKLCKPLLERLDGLVNKPTEDIIKKWAKEDEEDEEDEETKEHINQEQKAESSEEGDEEGDEEDD